MTTREQAPRPSAGCGSTPCAPQSGWRSRLRAEVVSQFGRPRGVFGRLAGAVMARRQSNVERSRWTVSLLDLAPGDRVLEVGFGPGIAAAEASRRVDRGVVVGLDHSELMLRQAAKRNQTAIREGRVRLILGSFEQLPVDEGLFDKIFAINTVGFWPRPVRTLRILADNLRPGGTIALTEQPRNRGADAATARAAGRRMAWQLDQAGLDESRVEILNLEPVPAVCVLAIRSCDRVRQR